MKINKVFLVKVSSMVLLAASQLIVLLVSLPLIPCAFNRYEEIISSCLLYRYVGVGVSSVGLALTLPLFYQLLKGNHSNFLKIIKYIYFVIILIELAIFLRTFLFLS